MTANQVTLARIFLLPIPCAMLLFADMTWQWIAFFLFVFLGMTDFIDGMMARREGPTKLGGLLDPVADKIMMAAITLSLSGNGWVPAWVPAAILSRELFVTVLRSSVAMRGQQVKTSNLAKMKTIIQMGGFGTIFMTLFLTPQMASLVAMFWMVFFLAIWAYWVFVRKESAPHWAIQVAGSFVYWFALLNLTSTETAILLQCVVIVGITWFSAIDYLLTSYKLFWATGLGGKDLVRLFWALAHGVLALFAASYNPGLIIPVLISMSFELGLGGVDNIAVAEGKVLNWRLFAVSGAIATWFSLIQTPGLAIILAVTSGICCWLGAREVKWRFF
ncbi:MAG: CDP-alcohol phosphatidyltransferase family protein [Myxococcota bacterium]